jgi:hypothetical protein
MKLIKQTTRLYQEDGSDKIASIQGFANFINMVTPEKGAEFKEQVKRIKEKYLRRQ